MSAFLLDTSAVIGLIERHSPSIRGALSRSTVDPVVSVLTFGELAHGVSAAASPSERRRRTKTATFAHRLPTLPLDGSLISDCYGFLSSSRRAGVIDRWIVAQAVINDLELLTEDAGIADLVGAIAWNDTWRRPAVTLCPGRA